MQKQNSYLAPRCRFVKVSTEIFLLTRSSATGEDMTIVDEDVDL